MFYTGKQKLIFSSKTITLENMELTLIFLWNRIIFNNKKSKMGTDSFKNVCQFYLSVLNP